MDGAAKISQALLPHARFRFTLKVTSLMVLLLYKGAVFRGAFGNLLKWFFCALPRGDCPNCLLSNKFLYIAVFEPAPPLFALNPPLTNRQVFLPDEIPDSDINLIGCVIDALHYCFCTFVEVGCRHLIRVCGEFEFEWIDLFSGKLSENLFKGQSQMIRI